MLFLSVAVFVTQNCQINMMDKTQSSCLSCFRSHNRCKIKVSIGPIRPQHSSTQIVYLKLVTNTYKWIIQIRLHSTFYLYYLFIDYLHWVPINLATALPIAAVTLVVDGLLGAIVPRDGARGRRPIVLHATQLRAQLFGYFCFYDSHSHGF